MFYLFLPSLCQEAPVVWTRLMLTPLAPHLSTDSWCISCSIFHTSPHQHSAPSTQHCAASLLSPPTSPPQTSGAPAGGRSSSQLCSQQCCPHCQTESEPVSPPPPGSHSYKIFLLSVCVVDNLILLPTRLLSGRDSNLMYASLPNLESVGRKIDSTVTEP